MGVWIETADAVRYSADKSSHPVWVCGLKPALKIFSVVVINVTPCMGVWIETLKATRFYPKAMSHPVWVCGLKLQSGSYSAGDTWSHPVWVCGLKRVDAKQLAQ